MKILFAFILMLAISHASAEMIETTEGCLYSSGEIKTAFGGNVAKIYGTTMTHPRWGNRKIIFCHYVVRSSSISSLTLSLTTSGENTELPKKLPYPWMKYYEPIPGDQDGALWRLKGSSVVELIYFHGNTKTKIEISYNPSQLDYIKKQALKLRRVP